MNHLTKVHRLSKAGLIKGNTLEAAFQNSSTRSELSTLITRTNQNEFHKTLLEWIVDMHIPFLVVENLRFQAWMKTTTPVAVRLLPKDGDTIRSWILQEFKKKQKELVIALHASKSLIHFSFDLWTSPNY